MAQGAIQPLRQTRGRGWAKTDDQDDSALYTSEHSQRTSHKSAGEIHDGLGDDTKN
jgi:hypothetical protein